MEKSRTYITYSLQFIAVIALLSLACIVHSELPAGECIGQWTWFDKASLLAASCILLSSIEPVVNYSTKKRLLLSLREYGCICLPIGSGEYTVTVPNFSNHTC